MSIMETAILLRQNLPWCYSQRQDTGLQSLTLAPDDTSAAPGSWLTFKSVEL